LIEDTPRTSIFRMLEAINIHQTSSQRAKTFAPGPVESLSLNRRRAVRKLSGHSDFSAAPDRFDI